MKHLNDQYYGNNKLREVGTPELEGDAANKEYVDAALKQGGVHVYRSLTGTEAKTTSPYWCARWDVADPKVTEYFDGMLVCVKVPVAGNGSYGTALQINDLGYKPIVWGLNTMITTRYPVGSVVWAVYNATQTATLYLGSGSQTITGCWQVMDYNSDTTTITYLRRYYGSRPKPTTDLYDYALVFRKDETQVVPIHAVRNGTSGTAANTSSTGTNKRLTIESFDPFGQILLYRNSAKVSAGTNIPIGTLYEQYLLHDARYIFNITTSSLTANKELYLVVDLQSDGMVKLATDVNPWSQTLPTTNDGHLYILLGFTYDTYRYDFLFDHPIYYHDGTRLRMYTGAKIPTKTSDLTNDSNYISGPDSSEAGNIAVFGNTAGNVAADSEVPVKRLWENVDVLSKMGRESYYIAMGTGLWAGTTTTYHKIIPVKDIRKVTIVARSNQDAQYAFLKKYTAPTEGSVGTAPDYATGYTTAAEVPAGETQSVDVPTDANYLYILQVTSSHTYTPDYVKFTGIGITEHTGDGSGIVKDDGSVDHSTYLTSEDVAPAAISGDYEDLTNKPTIPAAQIQSDWNQNDNTQKDYIKNKPTLFSGNYDDLANKPVNADFGQGLVRARVDNPSGATDISVTFTGYSLETGGMVSLWFRRDVPAVATLNINSQGAKPIYYRESALTDGVIKADDRCLFMYNSTTARYYLIAIDRWGVDIDALAAVARTGSYNDLANKPSTLFYGATSTPSSNATKVVDLMTPSSGFADGSYLLLHFYTDVEAGYSNAVQIGNDIYYLAYHRLAVTTAGVIRSGDKVLMLCYNAYAQIIAIDRWGEDIASKQDRLISGANIKTINGNSLLGNGDLTIGGVTIYSGSSAPSAGTGSNGDIYIQTTA